MKKINLFWYKHNEGKGNFGDELNPYIIERLSGKQIKYTEISYINEDKFKSIKNVLRKFYGRRISLLEFITFSYWIFSPPKTILAIGSILGYTKSKKNIIWGSGIIEEDATFSNGKFLAVRGHYTQKRLMELGYSTPQVIGDPALLLPIVYHAKSSKSYKVGIIPHFLHYKDVKSHMPENVLVINLLDSIESIIDQINSCELTLSTSLHGIIVSHCYAIPSLWVRFPETKNELRGDDTKFNDYFSSVRLPEYNPLVVENVENFDLESIYEIIALNFKQMLLPHPNRIREIQKDLLSVAPFPIKDKYLF